MTTFLEDPRFRQRWNQLSQNAEAATESAAAGIWTLGHRYITPCLGAVGDSLEACFVDPCIGDREERARRRRERNWGGGMLRGARIGVGEGASGGSNANANIARAEYDFDFYDDWDEMDNGLLGDDDEDRTTRGSGILGAFGVGSGSGAPSKTDEWDRLIGGSGGSRSRGGEIIGNQPKRKRAMSYGTRGVRRKRDPGVEDPTIIPSTAPLGFLGRLPFKIGGTLRYKPSAANLQDNPGSSAHLVGLGRGETQPLLGTLSSDNEDYDDDDNNSNSDRRDTTQSQIYNPKRRRSGTTGSGGTSDSFRSRNDLFPSDGEGDEDAIPLDDEFTVAFDTTTLTPSGDDSRSQRSISGKGKRPSRGSSSAGGGGGVRRKALSRTVSRTTTGSGYESMDSPVRSERGGGGGSGGSPRLKRSTSSMQQMQDSIHSIFSTSSLGGAAAAATAAAGKSKGKSQKSSEYEKKGEEKDGAAMMRHELSSGDLTSSETSASEIKSRIGDATTPAVDEILPEVELDPSQAHPLVEEDDLRVDEPSVQHRIHAPPQAIPRTEIGQDDDDFIPARLPHFR